MPYKSDAQRKFMHAAMDRGEIKPSVVKEYDRASKGKKLPEHVRVAKQAVRDHNKMHAAVRRAHGMKKGM
jgi:hypothetical protein